jgi:hypothetical protein
MGIHSSFAIFALAAGSNTRDDYVIPLFKIAHRTTYFCDDPDPLMAKDTAIGDLGHISFQDMQIRSANGGFRYTNDGVRGFKDTGLRFFFP